MLQLLILVGIVVLLFLLSRLNKKEEKGIIKPSFEMVKCKTCGVNLPKNEALKINDEWYCSKKHVN